MNEATRGEYDIESVRNIDSLREEIKRMYESDDPVSVLSDILFKGHEGTTGYITFGNNKIADNTGIFNMNSATDCPNADSTEDDPSDTGVCQVPWESCYAHKSENIYDSTLSKRRLQEYLWDCVTPELFAKAILDIKHNRRQSAFDYLRVSESGDFRHNGDIRAWDKIAQILEGEITVYTYSASHKLSAWDTVEHMTVNQSNGLADYGDRRFNAIDDLSNIPDDAIACAFDVADRNGISGDDRPKCGECTACIEPEEEQPRDVFIGLH